jgi:hypothetical protein
MGLSNFVSNNSTTHLDLSGRMMLAAGLLQTVGAMMIASSDSDIDVFAKHHPACSIVFAMTWILLFKGPQALALPVQAIGQVYWIGALPFVYLLFRFREVMQISEGYSRFSDLFAYSLSFDLVSDGVWLFLVAIVKDGSGHRPWPPAFLGAVCFFSGVALHVLYWRLRSTHSRRLALSTILFAYLLAYGFCYLAYTMVYHFLYDVRTPLIAYSFSIIHITFPLSYFAFGPLINARLGRQWMLQRKQDSDRWNVFISTSAVLEARGNIIEVETSISEQADLNAFVFVMEEDELTLLHLAVLNEHYDAVQRLLQMSEVQANKPSGSKGRTALFLAAELGRLHAMVLLLEHSADVNMLAGVIDNPPRHPPLLLHLSPPPVTDDGQSPLIVAMANGHTKVAAWLREHGANDSHEWMGLSGRYRQYSYYSYTQPLSHRSLLATQLRTLWRSKITSTRRKRI